VVRNFGAASFPLPVGVDTVQSDPADLRFLREPAMTSKTPWAPDDDEEGFELPDRTLADLAEEVTGEPASTGGTEEHDDARLTEEELEGAAGIQSPPGRID
jgi:hypothetical protein